MVHDVNRPLSSPWEFTLKRLEASCLSFSCDIISADSNLLSFTPMLFVEENGELLKERDPKCLLAKTTVLGQMVVGFGYEKVAGHGFEGFPVIGHQHRMQSSSGCERSTKPDYYCPWDHRIKGLRFFESSAAIPMRSLSAFIGDMKSLRDKAHPLGFCGLDIYTGFLIRFVKASSGAFLGAQEDVAMVDFTYYRARDAKTPRLDEDIFDEIEQIAFYKYGARPHWAKNRNYVFYGVGRSYRDIDKFLAVRDRFDPEGFFSSDWSDEILGVASNNSDVASESRQPYCALEGLCVCSEDVHCAPEKEYYCRPGRIYSDAKVCRFEDISTHESLIKMSVDS